MNGPQFSDLPLTTVVEWRFCFDCCVFDKERANFPCCGLCLDARDLRHDALMSPGLSAFLKMGLNASAYVDAFADVEQGILGREETINTAVRRKFVQSFSFGGNGDALHVELLGRVVRRFPFHLLGVWKFSYPRIV